MESLAAKPHPKFNIDLCIASTRQRAEYQKNTLLTMKDLRKVCVKIQTMKAR